jgi:hypothetical protein
MGSDRDAGSSGSQMAHPSEYRGSTGSPLQRMSLAEDEIYVARSFRPDRFSETSGELAADVHIFVGAASPVDRD